MPTDYIALKQANLKRYGTDIGRIGPMLLANRYDDRSHFLFELLQNAEDAIKRRQSSGSREVRFELSHEKLRFSHYGQLFTEQDVKGICGIGESTKAEDFTSIGKFGIGFKAVYAFTDSPEIHSGDEHFAIDSFVWPRPLAPIQTNANETVFDFQFRKDDSDAHSEISAAFKGLGVRTLLFLRQIEEIKWGTESGLSGQYLREEYQTLSDNARSIVLVGQDSSSLNTNSESWIVFSREVSGPNGQTAGHVEIAFNLEEDAIVPVSNSTLVVYFPTIVSTNLGFLIQGPYRTTPSRDNVPKNDDWNKYFVQETSGLLIEALHQLMRLNLLTVGAVRTLPIEPAKFGDGSMFEPLFHDVRTSLLHESLLPADGHRHVAGEKAKLSRTQELRELLDPAQLAELFEEEEELYWLSGDITVNQTPTLRSYLIRELDIDEVVPESILPKLTRTFLENQTDDWIQKLYHFLNGQPALQKQGKLVGVPLIRLEDGTHVTPRREGQPQAFLPSDQLTGFPTVRSSLCQTKEALAFLVDLGLTPPDPVDDVVRNVLPKYTDEFNHEADYEQDIQRILTAFATDSKSQRDKLLKALSQSKFVMSIDSGDGSRHLSKPSDLYLATQRLKDLFEGVPGVLLVDDSYRCLKGEDVRELLEACGGTRYLQPIEHDSQFNWQEKSEMRREAGCENSTRDEVIEDYTLRGLTELLELLPYLDLETAARKASLLWEALIYVEDRRGTGTFSGNYYWFYHYQRDWQFDAAFVRLLNNFEWVPDGNGRLQQPAYVVFADTGWKAHPFLQSKIHFKPPIIETLAKEAGLDPGLLDFLKKLGVTSEAELKARFNITDESPEPPSIEEPPEGTPEDPVKSLLGDAPPPTPPPKEEPEPAFPGKSNQLGAGQSGTKADRGRPTNVPGAAHPQPTQPSDHPPGTAGAVKKSGSTQTIQHAFISYVSTEPHEEGPDPDGLTHAQRVALEEEAIKLVTSLEPKLQRTGINNPGFDLVELDADQDPVRWVEVKAMKGTLKNRPVGLSKTQFEFAQRNKDDYWIYVVEQAGTPIARIVKIKDPAGKARTFTFDHGWEAVAET